VHSITVPHSAAALFVSVLPSVPSAAKLSSLLLPNGGFCFGPLDNALQLHGQGSLHRANSTEVANGQWTAGRLVVSGERDAEGRLHGPGAEWDIYGRYEGAFDHGLGALKLFDGGAIEGEWTAGQLKGFSIAWDKDGNVVKSGRWEKKRLVESRPVPLSKIPIGMHLSAAGLSSPHCHDSLLAALAACFISARWLTRVAADCLLRV
jgi:hypothetical protein